jgi:glycosyltransferase involved in cell wall biosynthesis
MKITWSLPVRGESLDSTRGDVVRARQLIEALQAAGHEVRVVEDVARPGASLKVAGYRRVVQHLLPRRVALVLRDVGRWLHGRAHGRWVASVAREQRADLLIETQVHLAGSGSVAARATGLPLILDDCSPTLEDAVWGVGLPVLARRVLLRQAQAATAVVAVSGTLRQRLIQEGVPASKLRMVPNGVDRTSYRAVDRETSRSRLAVTGRCLVGFVGSFQPWHQVELLVEAVVRMRQGHPVHLLLVGDGMERESVLEVSRRLGVSERVTAVGAVPLPRVPEMISACDVGVVPGSNDYGCPMKLFEYAAAGLPSIAPDLPPIREILEDGVTGILFPPGDVEALSAALARLAADPELRRRLGAAACDQVAAGASWGERARLLLECA